MDDLTLQEDALRQNLQELEWFNHYFGAKKVLLQAFDAIYSKYSYDFNNHTMTIGDLGCGGGDLLHAIARWAQTKQLNVELFGIDANPFMINYAESQSHSFPNIHYKTLDIFTPEFSQQQFDIVTLNNVCHHFADQTLITLFQQLLQQTKIAIIINDLHRHWLSYFAMRCMAKLFNLSYLGQHDGPLSVLRAFRHHELIRVMRAAQINSYQIRWRWPFRWQVIIWK